MTDIKAQMRLLKKIRQIRSHYQRNNNSIPCLEYLGIFFKKHRAIILGTIALFITQGIVETSLVVISRNQLAFNSEKLVSPFFWRLFIFLLVIFLINSFLAIKQEKTVIVLLINKLRRRIFRNYLGRPAEEMRSEKQGELIAKISYHLPLVSLGVSNSFFGLMRWFIYFISALIIAYLAGLNLPIIFTSFLLLSIIISIPAYFIAKKYVSQEVSFFSQIIKHIDFNLSEKHFLKNFNLEPVILKKFDELVEFDSIFRIRRDLWMKMGFKIVFALLLIVSVLNHIFRQNLVYWINIIKPELAFLYAFLLIYLSRIANESLRIGLYFFPAKLGFSLTAVKTARYQHRDNIIDIKSEIIFYSRQTKLFKAGKSYRHLNFKFLRGGRYLFYGSNLSGKTCLAKLFWGGETYNSKAVKIKIDGRRLDFYEYQKLFNNVYFFDPSFYSEKSLLEIILGQDREVTDFSEIARALKIIEAYPDLVELTAPDHNFSLNADKIWNNRLSAFALHSLHCLVKQPSLIIIDNQWLDLDYPQIKEILKILGQDLPEAILIIFAHKNINNLIYNQIYDLDQDFTSNNSTKL